MHELEVLLEADGALEVDAEEHHPVVEDKGAMQCAEAQGIREEEHQNYGSEYDDDFCPWPAVTEAEGKVMDDHDAGADGREELHHSVSEFPEVAHPCNFFFCVVMELSHFSLIETILHL